MFFVNGQDYHVMLEINNRHYLMHEPMPVIPRMGEQLDYMGKSYQILHVRHYYPQRPVHAKPVIYLTCQ